MKRIDIYYDGRDYSVGNRELDELLSEMDAAASTGATWWLEVNSSFGQARPTLLRITPSSNIAFTVAENPDEDALPTDANTP